MESIDKIEFDRTLISRGDRCRLPIQRFRSSADIWIQEPCSIQLWNTNERSDIIIENNIDVKSAGDTTISQENGDDTDDQFERDRSPAF